MVINDFWIEEKMGRAYKEKSLWIYTEERSRRSHFSREEG